MSRPYLTIKGYSEKYGVPRTTVQGWIKDGTLQCMKFKRPYLIPDDQPVPRKEPGYFNNWRWKREER